MKRAIRIPWNKGLKTGELSEEVKKKLSKALKGRKFSEEHKKKLSKVAKNRTYSNETRAKMSKIRIGIKLSKETRRRMSGRSGSKSIFWKGGISKVDKLCRSMPEYKQWRSNVFQRDNWICKTCGNNGYVTAHHIKGFSKIIKENMIENIKQARICKELWDINNGVTLCEECHSLTDNYKGRSINKNN